MLSAYPNHCVMVVDGFQLEGFWSQQNT